MTDSELEIARRIAEIEGYNCYVATCKKEKYIRLIDDNCIIPVPYNPFNWDILGPLMIKYDVSVNFAAECVSMYPFLTEDCANYVDVVVVEFSSKGEIPTAILKCISASKEY